MTLFANGTIRLRKGQIGNEWMGLAELSPDKLQAFLNRLSRRGPLGREEPGEGAGGGLDRAVRAAAAAAREGPQTYRFGHFDPLPLNLSHVVRIAKELGGKVRGGKETGRDSRPITSPGRGTC